MFHGAGNSDCSGIYEKYFISISYCIEPMGDDDFRGLFWQFQENLFEKLFGDGVDVGGSLIKNE